MKGSDMNIDDYPICPCCRGAMHTSEVCSHGLCPQCERHAMRPDGVRKACNQGRGTPASTPIRPPLNPTRSTAKERAAVHAWNKAHGDV